MSSRLSSLDSGTRRASAASFIQFDRQLRQNPARFIRSMFCTSVCARRCSTRRRKAAASSSVRVLSSSAMAASFHQVEIRGACCPFENSHSPTHFPAAEYLPLHELGYTRVRQHMWPKSDESDFGWEVDSICPRLAGANAVGWGAGTRRLFDDER